MSPIRRALTFDAFNTLFTPRQSIPDLYKLMAEIHHIRHDSQLFKDIFPEIFKSLNKRHPNYGKNTGITYQQWWYELIDRLYPSQRTNSGYQAFRSDLYESFKSDKAYTTFSDLNIFLETMSKREDTVLLCLSNGDPRVNDILMNLDLMKYFEEGGVNLSYDLDLNKSSTKFYEYISNNLKGRYGLEKSDIWHFGDEIINDLSNSNIVGWNSVLIDRPGVFTPADIRIELDGHLAEDSTLKRRLHSGYYQPNDNANNEIIGLGQRMYLLRNFNSSQELSNLLF